MKIETVMAAILYASEKMTVCCYLHEEKKGAGMLVQVKEDSN